MAARDTPETDAPRYTVHFTDARDARLRRAIAEGLELLDVATTATSYLARRALADAALNALLDALPSDDDEDEDARR